MESRWRPLENSSSLAYQYSDVALRAAATSESTSMNLTRDRETGQELMFADGSDDLLALTSVDYIGHLY
jgi:hypothetical protein